MAVKNNSTKDRQANYEGESLFVLSGAEEAETPHQWDSMPEFDQKQNEAWKMLKVRFRNEADLMAFAELVGQTVTPKTKGIWYPAADKSKNSLLRWMHEDQIEGNPDVDEVLTDDAIKVE